MKDAWIQSPDCRVLACALMDRVFLSQSAHLHGKVGEKKRFDATQDEWHSIPFGLH